MTKLFKQAEFHVTVTRIVDGDTVDVDIDLGFSTVLKKQRVRLMGIDTPESRTRDLVEKIFGKASKKHLTKLLSEGDVTLVSHDKGKFGRILGELFVSKLDNEGHPVFETEERVSVNQRMIFDHHAVFGLVYLRAQCTVFENTQSVQVWEVSDLLDQLS